MKETVNLKWAGLLGCVAFSLILYIDIFNFQTTNGQGALSTEVRSSQGSGVLHPKVFLENEVAFQEVKVPVSYDSVGAFTSSFVKDDLVFITFLTYEYRINALNWIVHMNKLEMFNFAFFCLDQKIEVFFKERNIICYPLYSSSFFRETSKPKKSLTTAKIKKIQHLWTIRLQVVLELLEAVPDTNIVMSDVDAVFLKNPISIIDSSDLVASRGQFPFNVNEFWGSTLCMGWIYFRNNPEVHTFLKEAQKQALIHSDDQVGVNLALLERSGLNFTETWHQPTPFTFLSDREPGHGGFENMTVTLLHHHAIPRCCSSVSAFDWTYRVVVAHCHPTDCKREKRMRNNKNWGSENRRTSVMQRYNIWCLGEVDFDAITGSKFGEVMLRLINTCKQSFLN